ncbi:kynureninase [Candidatus Marinimicrobia bacterium PRS2]|nr:kynureninase [Candidatus Marinimicrobia bacterium PRS2]
MSPVIKDIDLDFALEQDQKDPLAHFRGRFHFPETKTGKPFIYFCGNSLGLQPDTADQYIKEELDAWKKFGVDGHLKGKRPWLTYHELLTHYSAKLVGALDREVVVMNSLTVNLHLLMTSFYRPNGKRKKILIENNAFPSDRYAVQSQLKIHGNHPKEDLMILNPDQGETITTEWILDCFEHHGDEITMVLIGGVNYYSGQAFDMEAITKKAHEYNCLVGFDLAHGVGNLHLKLHDWGVDFAAWCGYKYLNGGPGAPSGVFIHECHLGKSDIPRFEGWWGHDKSTRFQMPDEFVPTTSAEAWQLSNPSIFSMAPLLASLELFHEAGIENLRKKSEKLTSYLEDLLENELEAEIEIITPKSIEDRGCQLSLRLKTVIPNIMDELHRQGILADWREPDVVRIAPVPLYNNFEDCYQFVQKIKKIVRG